MHRETQAIRRDLSRLAEDAQALLAATTDLAGEKVTEARKRLAAAVERSKEIYERVSEKAVNCAAATDRTLHAHPYHAVGVALGVGAIAGYLAARSCRREED